VSPLVEDAAGDERLPQDVADAWVTVLLDIWQKDQSGPASPAASADPGSEQTSAEELETAGAE